MTVQMSVDMNAALVWGRRDQLRVGDLKVGGGHAPYSAERLIEDRKGPAQICAIGIIKAAGYLPLLAHPGIVGVERQNSLVESSYFPMGADHFRSEEHTSELQSPMY